MGGGRLKGIDNSIFKGRGVKYNSNFEIHQCIIVLN
jgi:hypothetical protein